MITDKERYERIHFFSVTPWSPLSVGCTFMSACQIARLRLPCLTPFGAICRCCKLWRRTRRSVTVVTVPCLLAGVRLRGWPRLRSAPSMA